MSLKWSSCLLPCWDGPCALTPRDSVAEAPNLLPAFRPDEAPDMDKRALTADASQPGRPPARLLRSITDNRMVENRRSLQNDSVQSVVCIGADASSLLSVARPLGTGGTRVTVVDVVSEWITALKRSDLSYRLKVVGLDDEVTETTSHSVDACANFYADLSSERIIECDLIASALAAEELALFIPHLLTLLRRRKALNPNQPLRVLQIERVCLPISATPDLSESLTRAAEQNWPVEAMRWLAERVCFQQALAVEFLPQNIRSYNHGKIVALQAAQLYVQTGEPEMPGCEVVEDLSALRHMGQLAQSLSFLVGVAKNTTTIHRAEVQEALKEAFDAFASDYAWANKALMAATLAQMLCSSNWSLQQHTLDVQFVAACIQPALKAYQLAQQNDWKRLALRWLLHTSLVPLNHGGQIQHILEQFTENDHTFPELASLIQ